jgi:hypothetical protein
MSSSIRLKHQACIRYDCATSTELIGTLRRFEQSYFMLNANQRYILIIDSSTQVEYVVFADISNTKARISKWPASTYFVSIIE